MPNIFDKFKYALPVPCLVSTSGGRTSAYLVHEILEAFGGTAPDGIVFAFANTGKEDKRTLEFIRDLESNWGVKIAWVEYCRNETAPAVVWAGKQALVGQHDFKVVSFETADREGKPFAQLIDSLTAYREARDGSPATLPNPVHRFCSSELKIRTLRRYMNSIGYELFDTALGIRWDEPTRASSLFTCGRWGDHLLPLWDNKITEADVQEFWSRQPFDLGLKHDPEMGTYEGNCDFCFLKKNAKIKRLAKERPESLKWWAEQEAKTGANFKRGRFTYTDLMNGKIGLETVPADENETVQEACFCTD